MTAAHQNITSNISGSNCMTVHDSIGLYKLDIITTQMLVHNIQQTKRNETWLKYRHRADNAAEISSRWRAARFLMLHNDGHRYGCCMLLRLSVLLAVIELRTDCDRASLHQP